MLLPATFPSHQLSSFSECLLYSGSLTYLPRTTSLVGFPEFPPLPAPSSVPTPFLISSGLPLFMIRNSPPSVPTPRESKRRPGNFIASDGSVKSLHCEVCQVTLNAPAQARQHYDGKNHARKVKMSSDGDSSRQSSVKTSCKTIDPEVYCVVCCVSFNSSKQAKQHYQGKNHCKIEERVKRIKSRRSSSDQSRTADTGLYPKGELLRRTAISESFSQTWLPRNSVS